MLTRSSLQLGASDQGSPPVLPSRLQQHTVSNLAVAVILVLVLVVGAEGGPGGLQGCNCVYVYVCAGGGVPMSLLVCCAASFRGRKALWKGGRTTPPCSPQ